MRSKKAGSSTRYACPERSRRARSGDNLKGNGLAGARRSILLAERTFHRVSACSAARSDRSAGSTDGHRPGCVGDCCGALAPHRGRFARQPALASARSGPVAHPFGRIAAQSGAEVLSQDAPVISQELSLCIAEGSLSMAERSLYIFLGFCASRTAWCAVRRACSALRSGVSSLRTRYSTGFLTGHHRDMVGARFAPDITRNDRRRHLPARAIRAE